MNVKIIGFGGVIEQVYLKSGYNFTNIVKQIADIPAISVNPGLNHSKYSGLKAFSEGFAKEGVGAGGSIISSMLKTGNNSTTFLNLAEKEYDRLSAQRCQKS